MIELDVRDAGVEPLDPAWDEVVERLDLPQFWLAAAIGAAAGSGRQRVMAARVIIDGSTAGVACYRNGPEIGRWAASRFLGAIGDRLWLCAPPISFSSGLELKPELRTAERRRVRRAIERHTFQAAGRGPHLVGYPALTQGELERHGHARLVVQTAPAAVLDVTWPSLDHYLAGLPARRRKRFARLLEDIAGRDLEQFSPGGDTTIDPGPFCRLEQRTRSRHARPDTEPAALPPAYVEVGSAERAGWFGYRSGHGRLLQADLAFVARRELLITATAGEDRALADGLYTAVMLDEVAWAAANGIDRIAIGPGALDHKRRFGCRLEDQYIAVHPRI